MWRLVQRYTGRGPFARRTHETGNYIGIRERGQLIAMAGERMHIDGYVEIVTRLRQERRDSARP